MLNLYFVRTPSCDGALPVLASDQDEALELLNGTDLGGTPPAAQEELHDGRYTVEEIFDSSQVEDKEKGFICWSDASHLEIDVGQFLFIKTGEDS